MPTIILSAILGWNLNYMTIAIGVLVIIYRGDKGGKRNPKQQMFVIMSGMSDYFFLILRFLPNEMTFLMLNAYC
jgi:hypothetical protein